MTDRPPTLYHFTCSHGAQGIAATRTLKPNIHPVMRHLGPLLWLTDWPRLTREQAESIGLTHSFTTCDRTAYCYRVQTRAALPWRTLRGRVQPHLLRLIEQERAIDHWWVVRRPLSSSEFTVCYTPETEGIPT